MKNEKGPHIKSLMDPWIKKSGYPIVSMKIKTQNDDSITFEFEQHRFLQEGPKFWDNKNNRQKWKNSNEIINQLWPIPIEIKTADGKIKMLGLMKTRKATFTVKKVKSKQGYCITCVCVHTCVCVSLCVCWCFRIEFK